MKEHNNIRYRATNVLKKSLGLIVLLLTASCSNFLDESPVSNSSDADYWSNEAEGNSAVAGCYALLRKGLNSGLAHFCHGDLPTDEFNFDRTLQGEDFNSVQQAKWGISVPSTSTSRVMMRLRRFDYFYSAINQANLCIKNIPRIPKDEYQNYQATFNQFMGEAYFVRAFSYFYMARIWGDVPIVLDDTPEETDLANYERSPQADVLKKAIEDANTAKSYLEWDYANEDDYAVRANKGAVLALLAHIYAWQGNYEKCETAADELLDKGFYEYVSRDKYLDIFEGQSSEGIFEISQNSETEAVAATSYSGLASFLLKSPYLTTQLNNTLWPLDTLTLRQTLFTDRENDLRAINGFGLIESSDPVCIKYSKIVYTSDVSPLSLNNIIVFRLADIALLDAEAKAAREDYSGARTLLDQVRALANLDPSGATDEELFDAIIEERGRELYMEGHRFYDLVRLARHSAVYLFGDNKISAGEFAEGKYYWPIDPVLIENNPMFTQTTYWSSEME